jgi:hypothetical protein
MRPCLTMEKPEEETEDTTESERASEKPAGFGKADESDQKKAQDDEQADGMAG